MVGEEPVFAPKFSRSRWIRSSAVIARVLGSSEFRGLNAFLKQEPIGDAGLAVVPEDRAFFDGGRGRSPYR
jgi:hypothetical protein